MAKKNTPTNNGKKGDNNLAKPLLGLFSIFFSFYLFLALGSFILNGGADRSVFDNSIFELFGNNDLVTFNKTGKLGAWISDMLITNGIGLFAFYVPYAFMVIGLNTIGVKRINIKKMLFHGLVVSIWGSIFLGFVLFKFSDSTYLLYGGYHGYSVAKWLMASIGIVGTFLILFCTAIVYLAARFDGFMQAIINVIAKIANKDIKIPKISFSLTDGEDYQDNKPAEKNAINADDNIEFSAQSQVIEEDDAKPYDENDDDIDEYHDNNNDDHNESSNSEVDGMTYTKPGDDNMYDEPSSETELDIVKKAQEEEVKSNLGSLDTPYDPTADLSHYQYPPFDLLVDYKNDSASEEEEKAELIEKKNKIVETLDNFGIKIQTITATIGPTVTLYEIVPAPGVRISKIQGLQDDIALSLAALGIRIIAPMPGKGTIGIEVPNSRPQVVSMLSMVKSRKFQESTFELPIVMGKTISNEVFMFDLTKTPHLLVAGATGMGKSVGLNAIVTSILYKKHPSQVKFVLVDPKMVEFSVYKNLEKHFMAKMESEDNVIITDVDKVKRTLESLTIEMDDRYELLMKVGCRNIKEYNKKFINRQLNPQNGHRFLPYIVVIIDEFADLIMTAGKEIETPIARIAQKARAVGIHMIIATQRPSAKVITGIIKANFPTQIAFRVGTMVDSRCIIDTTGAQHLIGRGDMLFKMGSDTTRVQCALVDTDEVIAINNFIADQQGYATSYPLPEVLMDGSGEDDDMTPLEGGQLDSLFSDVAHMVVSMQSGSTSNIQRRFSLGYNRAGKLMDQLERAGIVGPAEGSKPRQVYVQTEMELERILKGFGIE